MTRPTTAMTSQLPNHQIKEKRNSPALKILKDKTTLNMMRMQVKVNRKCIILEMPNNIVKIMFRALMNHSIPSSSVIASSNRTAMSQSMMINIMIIQRMIRLILTKLEYQILTVSPQSSTLNMTKTYIRKVPKQIFSTCPIAKRWQELGN